MMANQLSSIPHMEPFIPGEDPSTTAIRWRKWTKRFNHLVVALNIDNNDKKKSLMLFFAGKATADVYRGLQVLAVADDADSAVDNVFLTAKQAHDEFFDPQRNTDFESTTFVSSNKTSANPSDYVQRRDIVDSQTLTTRYEHTSYRRVCRHAFVVELLPKNARR